MSTYPQTEYQTRNKSESSSGISGTVHNVAEQISESCCEAKDQTEATIQRYPISSTTAALGVGAALGLLIANALHRSVEDRRHGYIRALGDQISNSLGRMMPNR